MAILGYNTRGAAQTAFATGRRTLCKHTLASAGTLTELHGWFIGSGTNVILVIYADNAGVPGARVAYTSPLAVTNAGAFFELSQTGFSVSLPAGDYWIGWVSQGVGTSGNGYRETTGGTNYLNSSGATFNPPSDPHGGGGSTGATLLSAWAVYTTATPPVAAFSGTPLTGVAPMSVTFTDASTNTPTGWAWDFGDGGNSSSQNPSHNYTTPGTYTVTLTATNAGGSDAEVKAAYVIVNEPIVYAEGGGISIA